MKKISARLMAYFKSELVKEKFKRSVLISFAFTFSYIIFGPFDLVLNNSRHFPFDVSEVLPLFLGVLILAFVVLTIVLTIVPKGASLVIGCLLLGVLVASYIQLLFLNGSQEIMAGGWAVYEPRLVTINYIVWLLIIWAFLGLLFISQKKKINLWKHVTFYVPMVIFAMQFTGLIVVTLTNDSNFKRPDTIQYFSYIEHFELAKENNIIVFIFDRLDTKIMDDVLDDYPELAYSLSGFTYFQNSVSTYSNTFPSVTNMLTGEEYVAPLSNTQFFELAWQDTVFFDTLREEGFRINVLLDGPSVYSDINQVSDLFDNVRYTDAENIKVNRANTLSTLLGLGTQRSSPYIIKQVPTFFLGLERSIKWLTDVDSEKVPYYFPFAIFPETDLLFYEKLVNNGLNLNSEHNVFNIVHLHAAHSVGYNEKLETIKSITTDEFLVTQTRGAFKIVEEYIKQLKELDIYDNTTIIILADHGTRTTFMPSETENNASTASLLIKSKETAEGPLIINSTAELSHANFRASILELAGIENDPFGLSWFDIINNELSQERIFSAVRYRATLGGVLGVDRFSIIGDARCFSNWRLIND